MDWEQAGGGLAQWAKVSDPIEGCSRVMTAPAFDAAAYDLALRMQAFQAGIGVLQPVFRDAGRYTATMCALLLHLQGGLTLARLKDVCGGSGLLSPGRARALLLHLNDLGCVARTGATVRGVHVRYAPTPAFLRVWSGQLRAALDAACLIEPETRRLLARFDEPEVMAAFARIHASTLLARLPHAAEAGGIFKVFLHAYAGSEIIFALVAPGAGGPFPPPRTGPISVSAMARRFGVSRIHIMRVFDEAEQGGLARIGADHMLTFETAAIGQLRFFYAAQLLCLLNAAALAMAECADLSSDMSAAFRPSLAGRASQAP